MTLALAQILHLGNARQRGAVLRMGRATSNPYAIGAVLVSAALQVATLYVDPLPRLLRIMPLDLREWLVVAGCAALPGVVGQAIKIIRARPGRIEPA